MDMYTHKMQADLAAADGIGASLWSVEEVSAWCENSGGYPVSGDHLAFMKHHDR